jgi:hypothetical protein
MNGVYRYFMPCWGTFGEDGFSGIPQILKSLRPTLSKKEKFLGGMYDLNLKAYWETDGDDRWNIGLQRRFRRTSLFATTSKHPSILSLTSLLNGKRKLAEAIDGLDLLDLTIRRDGNRIELCLAPYGGGICFLALPPVRYTVPLPPEQRNRMVWTIEQLATLICTSGYVNPVSHEAIQKHISHI